MKVRKDRMIPEIAHIIDDSGQIIRSFNEKKDWESNLSDAEAFIEQEQQKTHSQKNNA